MLHTEKCGAIVSVRPYVLGSRALRHRSGVSENRWWVPALAFASERAFVRRGPAIPTGGRCETKGCRDRLCVASRWSACRKVISSYLSHAQLDVVSLTARVARQN